MVAHFQPARERPDRIRLAEKKLHRPRPPGQPRTDGLFVVEAQQLPPASAGRHSARFRVFSAAFMRFRVLSGPAFVYFAADV